jgi:predicted AAA+ superfamily ATPase
MEVKRLQPLTESEKNHQPGLFLQTLLGDGFKPAIRKNPIQQNDVVSRLLTGGYPEANQRTPARARTWHREYLRSIVERDVRDVARVKDADDVARLLKLLAIRTGEIQNTNALANELKLSNVTVDKYLSVLERLFLIRRLPSWQKNHANRLIKAPKIHLIDSGLSATLAGLGVDSWRDERSRMGHLLESFIVQQVISQIGWTDEDLQCQHYRDKDQLEVDLVITRGKDTWGIEVKASNSVSSRDFGGLKRLAEICGKHFKGGVVLYNGEDTLRLGNDKFLAVPISHLWHY